MARTKQKGWVLVTGATGGIGKVLIDRLLSAGYRVIAAARHPETIAGTGQLKRLALDLTDTGSIAEAGNAVAALTGAEGLAGLVNMAGIIVEGPLESLSADDLRHQMEVNLVAPFALTRAVLPQLKRARGTIVNIGAISAHLAVPFYGAISASKSALASLNDVMRLEFSRYGISVRLIEPGAMATGIFATARAACDDRLAALPEVEATWRPAMRAMETAFAKSGADDPDIVARAVMKALKGKGPARRVIGRGAGTFKMLGGLPIALRDPLIKDALGLKSYLLPR